MGDSAPHDVVLIARTCMRMNGPLGFKGRLELTEKQLSFKPTARLDRLVGAHQGGSRL